MQFQMMKQDFIFKWNLYYKKLNNKLRAVATDGHRLALMETQLEFR